jgi:hypothetical protein
MTVVFQQWGWLRRSKATVEAPAALEGRGESEAQAIRGREGGADGAHRRGGWQRRFTQFWRGGGSPAIGGE